jgi:hypothetical protein
LPLEACGVSLPIARASNSRRGESKSVTYSLPIFINTLNEMALAGYPGEKTEVRMTDAPANAKKMTHGADK